ncbi:MAG: biotin transporter BioY [Dehalococcoidia bacterium]|nr:biotin transporter BioY [Dehalococcoidia bacterium]
MQSITAVFGRFRYGAFYWRCQASLPWKITSAVLTAGLIGVLAQVRVPFFPVPLTGQTFGVIMAGVMLGRRWGGVSMLIYAALGLAGVPWFTGAMSGFTPTSGYLLGFVFATLFLGYFVDRKPEYCGFSKMFGLMLIASLVLIYLPGVLWLGFWMHNTGGTATITSVFVAGVLPFIAGDVLKSALAAALARFALPNRL